MAITRSKCKLVMFGSKSTLSTAKVFENMFEFLGCKNWVL